MGALHAVMTCTLLALSPYTAALHVHSEAGSGDACDPRQVVLDRHRELGFDVVVMTEHPQWFDVAGFSLPEGCIPPECDFLVVGGEELSSATPPDGPEHVVAVDTPSTSRPQGRYETKIDSVLANGGIPFVAHPRGFSSRPKKSDEETANRLLELFDLQ